MWVGGWERNEQTRAGRVPASCTRTHNKVLQSWEVSLFDYSAHQSLDMGAGMSDTGAEVKWEKVGLESESLEVWKAMVESFPNNNAKLTQHYCRKCPLFSPRPAGVHASPAPGLEKLENHAWHLHEPACDGGAICLAENCEFIQQTPPVSEVSSEHAPEQNNQKYHYHHYYDHYDHDHAVHHRCTSGLTRHDIQHTTHDSIPRREPLRQHPLPA